MSDAEKVAATFAQLSPLAQDVVKKMGWEVTTYGYVLTPVSRQGENDAIYLFVPNLNRIVYHIANAITDGKAQP